MPVTFPPLDFRSQVPTLEELETRVILATSIAATTTVYIGPTNLAQRVGGLSLVFSAAIAASDTDYWTIALQRIRANGTPVTLTSLNTKSTGGVAIAALTAYNFDTAVWPSALRYLNKDDILALVFTKTGAPAALANGGGAIRYEPDVLPLVRDTFTRNNNVLTMGNAESGQAWTVLADGTGAVFGINSNAAAIITHGNTGRDHAVVDAGYADCTVSAVLQHVGNAGIAVRMKRHVGGNGAVDGYVHNSSTFFRADDGALTAIGSAFSSNLADNDICTIVCSGSTFTVYKNGALIGTYTDATYTSTQHGLRNTNNTPGTSAWDDFVVSV